VLLFPTYYTVIMNILPVSIENRGIFASKLGAFRDWN
jgi:hypothetical protein